MHDTNRYSIILWLSLLISTLSANAIVRIQAPDNELWNWIDSEGIEVLQTSRPGFVDLYLTDSQMADFAATGHYLQILTDDHQMIRDLEGYRDYASLTAELQLIADTYPDIVHLTSLGPSTCHNYYLSGMEGYEDYQHEIWCLRISNNPDVVEDEPHVLFASEIHARETISMEVDMYILNHLVQNYGVDDDVTQWVDNTQIYFIPLINPDGHKLVTDGTHLMHRKNMRDNNGNELPDASTVDGVDLNRNFGYVWGSNGTSSNPSSSLYHGPSAWSETETVYIRDLLQSHKFYGAITYHSSGEWVLYPLGHLPNVCSYDYEIMDDLAVRMAATIPKISGYGTYTPAQAVDFGYTCQGTMGDWGYSEERLFSFTIELGTTYIPPVIQIEQICEDNLEAALIFLDRVHASTVTGHVTDPGGNPIVADVIVNEIDLVEGMTDVEPVRSGTTFGRYYRLLLPGEYSMVFSADGYYTQNAASVTISESEITELDIALVPLIQGDLDQSGSLDVVDIVLLVGFILGTDEPEDYEFELSDFDDDGELTVSDIIQMVAIIIAA